MKFSFGKIRHFQTSKTEHTDDLLRFKTEHTESPKSKDTESLLRPKMTIPNKPNVPTFFYG